MKYSAEEKEIVAKENIDLINFMIQKFKYSVLDESELRSAANLGFTRALNNFDKDKGYKLSTLACKCIQNELIRAIEKEKRRRQASLISFDMRTNDEGDNSEKNLYSLLSILDDDLEAIEMKSIIENVSSRLDDRRGLVLKKILEDKSHIEIAKEIGIGRGHIYILVKSIREEFIKEMGKN